MSMQPRTTSSSCASPWRWPSIRGRPRWLAHRPLPSMTSATWFGTSSAGMSGAVAPLGCGVGAITVGSSRPRSGAAGRASALGAQAGAHRVDSRFGSEGRRPAVRRRSCGPSTVAGMPAGQVDAGRSPPRRSTSGQRAQGPLEVPLQVGGDEARGVAAGGGVGALGGAPVAVAQRLEQPPRLLGRDDGPGRAAALAHRAARGHREAPVVALALDPAAGALGDRGRPAGDDHRAQQEGVEHEVGVADAAGEPAQARRRAAGTARAPARPPRR